MTIQTINKNFVQPLGDPNSGDSSEMGDTWGRAVDKINASLAELAGEVLTQAAPAAKTTSTTLTAAELLTRLITGNQGAAGAAAYQLPLAADLETALLAPTAFPNFGVNQGFDFTVINLSAVDAEDITITTNTGWTLVGRMDIESTGGTPARASSGTFRVRRTAANAYTLYRLA